VRDGLENKKLAKMINVRNAQKGAL